MKGIENETEERLLVEAAQQDPARFAELYENNFDRVYAFIARRVPNRQTAEDVTAEVFHQALANLARFQWRGAPFVAWLLGIAANVLAGQLRRAVNGQEVSADALQEPGVEDGIEQRTMLLRLMDRLPSDQRHVLMRRFVDQQSARDIAEELGRSEGAVKQLQFRALQTLRALVRSNHHG